MPDKLNFQDTIARLIEFWKGQGCLVWHPHNVQVGAGTMNPATVLRVLGPEPWNIVYLEPSIRPDDGRFGDNPNRMQQHYQLQVILKPDPGDPQEKYLASLEVIGIDLRQHDIRFVEDNWEQPALGAWGLGWEVWLDGQEITQFTYFQQAGGVNLDPVSVELTYGLDRIALAMQDVDSVWKIDFGSGTQYGDLLLQAEMEHCHCYFNVADVAALKKVYDIYEAESLRCLESDLVAPAHDFNLKCSFLFNVMDTRGAIGVTERANYFRRMRSVAQKVAEAYLDQRQRLEYPFSENALWQVNITGHEPDERWPTPYREPQSFLLELGSEELPAGDLSSAIKQLEKSAPKMFADLRLEYEGLEILGTPRRLALVVTGLAPRQADLEMEVKGPPADRAFDDQGRPTKAALGFARSRGVAPEDLTIVTEGRRAYAAAVVREAGLSTEKVLAEALPELIAGIGFDKTMRWNHTNVAYSRPIRWLVSLFGEREISFDYAGVSSGRISRGLRLFSSPEIEIEGAAGYLSQMTENDIVVHVGKRKAIIIAEATELAGKVGGVIGDDPELIDEITNLVEQPTMLLGRFEDRFLDLPVDALVAVMRKHQRYIPVYRPDGQALMPYFITARNGDGKHLDLVRDGNEHVIRARFADAEFFYRKDSERGLAEFLPRLNTLTFQAELGSMLDKVHRLERLVPAIAQLVGLSERETADAVRAASLSKADLASSMVVEMTALQGIMGGIYARMSGEKDSVCEAIAEQYEAVSHSRPGLALALSDRIDSLLGLFAAGLAPKGSNDPFALRRAAIQIIENLIANRQSLDLRQALAAAAPLLPVDAGSQVRAEVLEFISNRLETYLQDRGIRTSVVRAILAEQGHDPYQALVNGQALAQAVEEKEWPQLLDAYARCVRIIRDQPDYELDPEALSLPEERALLRELEGVQTHLDGSVEMLVHTLRTLKPTISAFFDNVLVMDEDPLVRQNRLALLQRIAALTAGTADLSKLEGF